MHELILVRILRKFLLMSPPIIDDLSSMTILRRISIRIDDLCMHNCDRFRNTYSRCETLKWLFHITYDLIDNRQPYINCEFRMENNWANDAPALWSHSQCFLLFYYRCSYFLLFCSANFIDENENVHIWFVRKCCVNEIRTFYTNVIRSLAMSFRSKNFLIKNWILWEWATFSLSCSETV